MNPYIERAEMTIRPGDGPKSRPNEDDGMSNAKLDGRSMHGTFGGVNTRRARRAERQILVNNVAVAGAFLFVSAVVFGLV